MVEEPNEKYDGEEGEYHFSDDHASYELESETLKAGKPSAKEPGGNALAKYRRVIIAGSVFIVLMFVVYKMISPSTTVAPPTDFSKATAAPKLPESKPPVVADTIKPSMEVPVPVPAPAAPTPPPVAQAQQPALPVTTSPSPVAVTPTPTSSPVTTTAQQQLPPPPLSPSPVEMATAPAAPKMPATSPGNLIAPPMPSTASTQQPVVTVVPAPTPAQPGPSQITQVTTPGIIPPAPLQSNDISERVAALEQQNAKLTNLLQIEYSQKISDQDSQTVVMRNKILELNKRLASMEAALSQITQLLQETASGKAMPVASSYMPPPSRVVEPKQTYSVQAIIPGRAWLKSDAGDTVTVAEGDMLKSYGRITKIDPYDGIVQIYTGNKTITLSYGLNGDA